MLAGARFLGFPVCMTPSHASDVPAAPVLDAEPDAAIDPSLNPTGDDGVAARLNKLRAGVLGANDGIVSVAAVVVGVAGATSAIGPVITAGAAAVIGGAVSMALGEYVSVSSQRDALLARRAAGHDVEDDEIVSPWHAAIASSISFFLGALLPMIAIILPPAGARIPVTFAATLLALAITGAVSARIGGGSRGRAALRLVIGGALALAVTFAAGSLLGASGVV